MSGTDAMDIADQELVFESDLDAPPEKVWRALTTTELRDHWLDGIPTDPEPVSQTPGEEVSYRMRDDEPPFFESTVVFRVRPGETGEGTRLTIIHRLSDERLRARPPVAANSNLECRMRAA